MDTAPVKMFVGIRVPVDIAVSLTRFRPNNPDNPSRLRWADPDDLHITLKFLGPQMSQVAAAIRDGLVKISRSQLDVTFNGAGVFDDVGVLFIRIFPDAALMQLQRVIDRVAQAHGVSTSEHPFTPHISLARIDTSSSNFMMEREYLHRMSLELEDFCRNNLPRHGFRATELMLFESRSGHYVELFNFPFKAEGATFDLEEPQRD